MKLAVVPGGSGGSLSANDPRWAIKPPYGWAPGSCAPFVRCWYCNLPIGIATALYSTRLNYFCHSKCKADGP